MRRRGASEAVQWRRALLLLPLVLALAGAAEVQVALTDSWADKIGSAAPGDSVVFEPGRYGGCSPGGVALAENVTLLGREGAAATVIDCGGAGRHFHVSNNASVRIEGLTLTGGYSSNGGCVLVAGTSSALVVSDSVFSNCRAAASGGAISFRGEALTVRGCNLTGNVAVEGAGIHAAGSSYSVEVEATSSTENAASFSGGGMHFEGAGGTISIDRSHFTNNTASELGGGVTVTGPLSLTVRDSTFTSNNVLTPSHYSEGKGGGGICANAGAVVTILGHSKFVDCNVLPIDQSLKSVGGGISVASTTLRIDGPTLISRCLARYGGGIHAYSSGSVELTGGVVIDGNRGAIFGGGLGSSGGVRVTLRNGVLFKNNEAVEFGGGIRMSSGGSLTVKDGVRFENNEASTIGGAVFLFMQVSLSMTGNVIFEGNRAVNRFSSFGGNGGAGMFIFGIFFMTIADGPIFRRNVAHWGGAIKIDVFASFWRERSLVFRNCSFIENEAHFGGAVAFSGLPTQVQFDNVLIANNTASERGGGIMVERTSILMSGGTSVVGNTARQEGGGVYIEDISFEMPNKIVMRIEGSGVSSNTAASGGGIFAKFSTVEFAGGESKIMDNTAGDAVFGGGGGGISLEGSTMTVTSNATISGNVANGAGGGVQSGGGSVVEIKQGMLSVFSNNGWEGAGLYLDGTTVVVESSLVISANEALTSGGGIFGAFGMSLTVSSSGNCQLFGNRAQSWGGAIHLQVRSKLNTTGDFSCSENIATFGGGVSLLTESSATLGARAVVDRNRALEDGGGVYLSIDSTLTMTGGMITRNTAVSGGGVRAEDLAHVELEGGSQVRGNTAGRAGGGISLARSTLKMSLNASVVGNKAAREGGGVDLVADSKLDCHSASVVENVAQVGGGLHLSQSTATLESCAVNNNLAETLFCEFGGSMCGGGGFLVSGAAVVVLNNSNVEGNVAGPAGSGGGMLLTEKAEGTVQASAVHANSAGGDGGGVASLWGSKLTSQDTLFHHNVAGGNDGHESHVHENLVNMRGGALFAGTNTSLILAGSNTLRDNSAEVDGGAVFTLSDVSLSAGGHTMLQGNRARTGKGGGLVAKGALVVLENGHSLAADANSAGVDGGAAALLSGARILVKNATALKFTANTATAGNGGAVFRDSEGCLLSRRRCFLDGLAAPNQQVLFQRNRAGGVGGAAHVACAGLSTECKGLLQTPAASWLQLQDNTAGLYGTGLSTQASRIAWHGAVPKSVAPGFERLSVAALLYDQLGSHVRGSGQSVRFWLCGAGSTTCGETAGLVPSVSQALDAATGVSSTSILVECLLGSDTVVVRAGLAGTASPALGTHTTVACRCDPGQARSVRSTTWVCNQCPPDTYVLDPNYSGPGNYHHKCENCPAGAHCYNSSVWGTVGAASVWVPDMETGRYTLTHCPPGYAILVPAQHDEQTCVECGPGRYCEGGAASEVTCPVSSHSKGGASSASDCVKVAFVALSMSLPLSEEAFASQQEDFKAGLASAAATTPVNVIISEFFQTTRRGGRQGGARELLAESVQVVSMIAAPDEAGARTMIDGLDEAKVNTNLILHGIPAGEIKNTPSIVVDPSLPPPFPVVGVSAGITVGLMVLFVVLATVLHFRWRKASRRLLHANKGTSANQRDLPYELRAKYTAVQLLGHGGSGIVIEVHQIYQEHILQNKNNRSQRGGGDNKLVANSRGVASRRAVKLVHKGYRFTDVELRGMQRESALLGRIQHPNVVHFHEAGLSADGRVYWMSMELVSGETLEELLRRVGVVTQVESIQVMLELCSAVKAIHNLGVIHRDLKPGNIIRAGDGTHRVIDLGTARAADTPARFEKKSNADSNRSLFADSTAGRSRGTATTLMSGQRIHFNGTPAYAAPENFMENQALSFAVDIWSLSAVLFEMVAGDPPFGRIKDTVAAGAAIAGNLKVPVVDVRDAAPEEVRSGLSSSFAGVIARGLKKHVDERFQNADEFATALYTCLVDTGEESYSTFVSYRVSSEKVHAQLLHEVLNNSVTPAGHRVINYLDVKRLVPGENWEQGFSQGLFNSLVALPLVSTGMLAPMTKLKGTDHDRPDNVLKELLIMQSLRERLRLDRLESANLGVIAEGGGGEGNLEVIFPILVGKPCSKSSAKYPGTGNFFEDGTSRLIDSNKLVEKVSPSTTRAVCEFLERTGIVATENTRKRSVFSTVSNLLALQGLQLWTPETLEPEEVSEGSPIWTSAQRDPADPALDFTQFCKLKAELRALVPRIHAQIDLAHAAREMRKRLHSGGVMYRAPDHTPTSSRASSRASSRGSNRISHSSSDTVEFPFGLGYSSREVSSSPVAASEGARAKPPALPPVVAVAVAALPPAGPSVPLAHPEQPLAGDKAATSPPATFSRRGDAAPPPPRDPTPPKRTGSGGSCERGEMASVESVSPRDLSRVESVSRVEEPGFIIDSTLGFDTNKGGHVAAFAPRDLASWGARDFVCVNSGGGALGGAALGGPALLGTSPHPALRDTSPHEEASPRSPPRNKMAPDMSANFLGAHTAKNNFLGVEHTAAAVNAGRRMWSPNIKTANILGARVDSAPAARDKGQAEAPTPGQEEAEEGAEKEGAEIAGREHQEAREQPEKSKKSKQKVELKVGQ